MTLLSAKGICVFIVSFILRFFITSASEQDSTGIHALYSKTHYKFVTRYNLTVYNRLQWFVCGTQTLRFKTAKLKLSKLSVSVAPCMGYWAKPPKCHLARIVKHTDQVSWRWFVRNVQLQSKSVCIVCKLFQLLPGLRPWAPGHSSLQMKIPGAAAFSFQDQKSKINHNFWSVVFKFLHARARTHWRRRIQTIVCFVGGRGNQPNVSLVDSHDVRWRHARACAFWRYDTVAAKC